MDDLRINYENVESLSVEILFDQKKNMLFNVLFMPHTVLIKPFEKQKFY